MRDQIYFVRSGQRIKIGVSNDVTRRLREIECHLAEPLSLIGTTDGSVELERGLHQKLRAYHVRGEWFRDCPEVRTEIESMIHRPVRDWLFVNARADRPARGTAVTSEVTQFLMTAARARWPEKTAQHLATMTRMSVRACKYWLSGRNEPSGVAMAILQKELGGPAA